MANCNPILPRSHINLLLLLLLLLFVKGRLIDIQFLLSSGWLCNKVPDIQQIPPGYSWEFLVGVCRPVLQILTLCQTKKISFSTPVFRPGLWNPYSFSDLEVVKKRNITCLHKTEIMSSLLRLKPQQKDFLKSIFEFAHYTFFLSFGIETTNKSIHNRSSFVNHTRFETKMHKIYSRFRIKTAQKTYPYGRHIPKWLTGAFLASFY